jgi:prepilin-type N-terminal cleavage/methylation domain-containing protein
LRKVLSSQQYTPKVIFKHRSSASGFTLLEIMAAVTLLALIFTTVMQIRAGAIDKAVRGRSLSISSRLGKSLLHQIESALVIDLVDGYTGDFSEEGFGQFKYVVGVGDSSQYSSVSANDLEDVWRDYRKNQDEDNAVDEDVKKPEFTRVFITVTYPTSAKDETEDYVLEALVDTWAVERDFELYDFLWPELNPEEIK